MVLVLVEDRGFWLLYIDRIQLGLISFDSIVEGRVFRSRRVFGLGLVWIYDTVLGGAGFKVPLLTIYTKPEDLLWNELVPALPLHNSKLQLIQYLPLTLLPSVLEQGALDVVTGVDGADAGGRACEEEVTFLEGHDGRDVLDEGGDAEDHVGGGPILFGLGVYLSGGMRGLSTGRNREEGKGRTESLRRRLWGSETELAGMKDLQEAVSILEV